MANPIGWCDETVNLGVGCAKCSPGCRRCYALPMAVRLAHNPGLAPEVRAAYRAAITKDERPSLLGEKPAWRWSGKFVPIPGALERFTDRLQRWRKPRIIFLESMGDLFHESRPEGLLDKILCLATFFPRHAFVFLTKRVKSMADSLMRHDMRRWCDRVEGAAHEMWGSAPDMWEFEWPLPNLWLMTTVEDQERADERIPELLRIPAALHGVSVEPQLGEVELSGLWSHCPTHDFPGGFCHGPCPDRQYLDWVICGGETGPGAREADPAWVRSLRDQCAGVGAPFWFKGWGGSPATKSLRAANGCKLDGRLHQERPAGGGLCLTRT